MEQGSKRKADEDSFRENEKRQKVVHLSLTWTTTIQRSQMLAFVHVLMVE